MFLMIENSLYVGAKNDFSTCGVRYDVIYQGDMITSFMVYGVTHVGYDSGVSGNKCIGIKTDTGFIEVPIKAIERMSVC